MSLKAWERFWFGPQATSTLALVRIATGAFSLGWALSLLPDLFAFFSEGGVVPGHPRHQGQGIWGLLELFPTDAALVAVYVAFIVASVALIIGLFSRLAALIVFLCLLSFSRRNGLVLNSGDGLLRVLSLFLVFSPSGSSLSLDRLRRAKDSFWDFPARAPWALRLIQIQLSVLYVSTVWQKVRGARWNDGTAVSYAQRVEDLERFPMPGVLKGDVTMANLQTFGTLAVELSLGILVWNRVLRPWVLGAGVVLHLGIEYSMRVGFFGFAIFACYLAFIPPETARSVILWVRDRLGAARLARLLPARLLPARQPDRHGGEATGPLTG